MCSGPMGCGLGSALWWHLEETAGRLPDQQGLDWGYQDHGPRAGVQVGLLM